MYLHRKTLGLKPDFRFAANIRLLPGLFLSSALPLYFVASAALAAETSVCFGTPANGRLEHGMQLPASGHNFQAYHWLGVAVGRNYVHSKVYAAVIDAYAALDSRAADKFFVYGESGWPKGGRLRPHKTHQNGLSVDFFVPVLNSRGVSVALPSSLFNQFGYGVEFDDAGRFGEYKIDFTALAEHLWALQEASDKQGIKIRHVIFDNALQELLFQTPAGSKLPAALTFSRKKPWIRHDEHYHVDFIVPCRENT